MPIKAHSDSSKEALNKAAKAFYLYEHWDKDISNYLEYYERNFTKEEKATAGYAILIIKAIGDKQIQFTWHFP